MNAEDPHDTFRDAARFHATRLDWVYSTDSAWIRQCTELSYSIGTALNSKLPDSPGVDERLRGRIRDREGALVTAPWMEGWDAWWGCVNSPDYQRTFVEHARRCLDGGALYLHVDDPDMNYRAIEWGGCFCSFCQERAASLGVDLTDPPVMRQFQRTSVTHFYEKFRRAIDRYAGRHVPVSCNNYRAVWDVFPYTLFDFGMAELPEADAHPDTIYRRLSATRGLGKAQILTFVSEDTELSRRVIATAYALGSHVLVPWDVYLKSTPEGSIRYFGRPEDFADLYGFIRASQPYLDGYEEAAVAGSGHAAVGGQPKTLLQVVGGNVLAVVRAQPGRRNAPVVLHLVSWGGEAEGTLIRIRRDCLPDWDSLRATLYTPATYTAEAHHRAARTHDYGPLASAAELARGGGEEFLQWNIPRLGPWGILVVSPDQSWDHEPGGQP